MPQQLALDLGVNMSINLGQENTTFDRFDRVWRVEMTLDDNDVVKLIFHREIVYKLGNVVVHRKRVAMTEREQSQIANKDYTAGGVTRTGNQILALVQKMADDERLVDIG